MNLKEKAIEEAARACEIIDDTLSHLYCVLSRGNPIEMRLEEARRLLAHAKLLRDKQQKGGGQ